MDQGRRQKQKWEKICLMLWCLTILILTVMVLSSPHISYSVFVTLSDPGAVLSDRLC